MIVRIIWFHLVWIEWVICFQAWHSAFPLHGWSHLRSPNKRASSFSLPSKYPFALNEGMTRYNSQVNECQSKSQPWCVFFPSLPDLATSSLSLSKQLSFSDCKKKKERKKEKWNLELTWTALPRLVRSCHGKQLPQDASWQTHSVGSQVVLILRHSLGKLYPHPHLKPLTICWLLSGKMDCSLCFCVIW